MKKFLGITLAVFSMSCRTEPNPYLLEDDEALAADNMGVELVEESSAEVLCQEMGTYDAYFLRPIDGDDYPMVEVNVCIDEKFNVKGLDVFIDESPDRRLAPNKSTIKVDIPTEFIVGLFDQIHFTSTDETKVVIAKDYDTILQLPGFPEVQFYTITVGESSPVTLYQSNPDDQCPREWYAPEQARQKYESVAADLLMETYMCQSATAGGNTSNLPLWIRFDSIPADLESDLQDIYRFVEMNTKASRRNFRHEISFNDAIRFTDSAITDTGLYPSRIREYRLEATSDTCDLDATDADFCLEEDTNIAWSYPLVRDCVSQKPTGECKPGAFLGEFYCHGGEWRCRHRQLSKPSFKKWEPAGSNQLCEPGDQTLFLPSCQAGLTCVLQDDDTSRCQ